jgi:hypothetical protein
MTSLGHRLGENNVRTLNSKLDFRDVRTPTLGRNTPGRVRPAASATPPPTPGGVKARCVRDAEGWVRLGALGDHKNARVNVSGARG